MPQDTVAPRRTRRAIPNLQRRIVHERAPELKLALMKVFGKILDDNGLTQTEAARLMRDSASQVSLVYTRKSRGFSVERLISMVRKLGASVEVRITIGKVGKTGRFRVVVD